MVSDFVYTTLSFSPVSATAAGYHVHEGVPLDGLLDDVSEAAMERQRDYYSGVEQRLKSIAKDHLTPEQQADYDLIDNQAQLALLELNTIQSYKHNPASYVELLGSGLYTPYVVEYAPKEQRFGHIISRLDHVQAFLENAKTNLKDAPPVWTETAIEENDGNIGLIDGALRRDVPEALKPAYEKAAGAAIPMLKSFNEFLKNDLSKRTSDWRLGKQKYDAKFRLVLGTDRPPSQILADAEEQLHAIRREMFKLSLPLHHKFYPTHRDPVDVNLIVGETLAKIAEKHATPATYISDARRDLAETTAFVREKNLVPLYPTDNLKVIETPEFMRGIYSVGGFNPAPPLQPELGAFYWITPIPADWPKDRVESKLREYNYYGLKLITIHEAMPGHYVQFEYADRVEPRSRRLLRALYGSGPYIEGWAVYATEMMLDQGYLNNDPELRLTFLKQMLRAIANSILDIRFQTMGLTDEEAMDLMVKQTFQEKEEATGKLRRAKLSSCQLPTYYVGYVDWLRLRGLYHHTKGQAFSLTQFHQDALRHGALPLPVVAKLLTGQDLGKAQSLGVK